MRETHRYRLLKNGFAFCLVLLLSTMVAFSQSSEKKKSEKKRKNAKPELGFEIGFRTMYDDNILKYSDKYLERFKNRQDEGRFHINTYDDFIMRPSLKIYSSHKFFANLKSEFDANINRSIYAVNGIKNWDFFSIGLRQFYHKKGSIKFNYSYIPEFYIRHYIDDDHARVIGYIPDAYKTMSFSKETYGFWIHQTVLKNTGVRFIFDYAKYFYNVHYIEYDSDDLSYELRLFQPVFDDFKLQLAYSFTTSKAKGFDQPDETFELSDDADASFTDNEFAASVEYQLPLFMGLEHDLTVGGSFSERHFTTSHFIENDMLHAGRVDFNYNFSVSYGLKLSKSVNTSLFYTYLKRTTDSKSDINKEMVSLEKSYRQNQFGFAITYNFKL